jgi:hypothetical protein
MSTTRAQIAEAVYLGYRHYPNKATRFCAMCGPFASEFIRLLADGEPRCKGCDEEN